MGGLAYAAVSNPTVPVTQKDIVLDSTIFPTVVTDSRTQELQLEILHELRKMNRYLSLIKGEEVLDIDINQFE